MARPRYNLRSSTKLKLQRIVRLELLGQTPKEIAPQLDLKPDSVRELMRHPEYQQLRNTALERAFAPVDAEIQRRAGEVLEHAAPDAAEALVELLNEGDCVTRRLSATAILDRSGHGPIQRRAVRHRHELDPDVVRRLTEAMRVCDAIDIDVIEAEIEDAND